MRRSSLISAIAASLVLATAGVARADPESALHCPTDLARADRTPVLFVPGTTLAPENYSWNWLRALDAAHWPYCSIALPDRGMSDVQTAGEYLVYAIRTMYARYGGRIDVVGHSQGGMAPRWAFRFFPDTRAMVDDLVGLSPSNHGTLDANGYCAAPGGCPPSFWQQRAGSRFLGALNSGQETFPGISYSVVYTRIDEVVVPNVSDRSSSSLHGGGGDIANVSLQDVCPVGADEHLAIGTYSNVAFRLAMDALTHPGPADPRRVSRSVCADPFMPGVDRKTFVADYADMGQDIGHELLTYPRSPEEPPLRCYATAAGCD
jgi:pimeloyl-ACP methyl ester carboxylesterase